MTRLTLIRHGPTPWNRQRRIQGRRDVPLDARGRRAVQAWHLPASLQEAAWYVSPLSRALATAVLLGVGHARVEPRLAEMDWGEWEGFRLEALRERLGERFARAESRGLDFRPPGGESPRMLGQRVATWLAEVAARGEPAAAVTHKGVIRAVYARATGWDMTGPPPRRLLWHCAHCFVLDRDGRPGVERLNVELVPGPADTEGGG